MSDNYKICIKCRKEFPATKEFFHKGNCTFGLRNVCKVCCSIYNKQHCHKYNNKDKNIKRCKEWRAKNIDHVKAHRKQYYEANKERRNQRDNKDKQSKYSEKWRAKNVEYLKGYRKRYREATKEKRRRSTKKWRIKNADHIKQYQKDNRAEHNARTVRYRARKLNQTPPDANMEIIQFYYTVATTLADYQVDHYQPLNKGGLHHEDNLQLLQSNLNQEKRDKWPLTPEEKIRYKGYRLGGRKFKQE